MIYEWNNSEQTSRSDDGEEYLKDDPCAVRLETDRMEGERSKPDHLEISYQNNDGKFAKYAGEKGDDSFRLACPEEGGKATLRFSVDGKFLKGRWG